MVVVRHVHVERDPQKKRPLARALLLNAAGSGNGLGNLRREIRALPREPAVLIGWAAEMPVS